MGKVITFINMKGGVGKTTLSVNIGYTLSQIENKKVLLIDMDPQMNATQYALKQSDLNKIIKDHSLSSYKFLCSEYKSNHIIDEKTEDIENDFIFNVSKSFDIIPSTLDIMNISLASYPYKLQHFINDNLRDKYDLIIIDCPPTISEYTKISLLASDMYLVPTKANPLSVFGLPILQDYINETIVKQFGHRINFLGIVLTMVITNRLLYKKHKEELKEKWPAKIFLNELKQCEEITKAVEYDNPEDRFILNINNEDVVQQIKNITKQLCQKGNI